jgi:hypothetical protein
MLLVKFYARAVLGKDIQSHAFIPRSSHGFMSRIRGLDWISAGYASGIVSFHYSSFGGGIHELS